MKTVKIPAPGIVLGNYPERGDTHRRPFIGMAMSQWTHWQHRKLREYLRFVCEVRDLERRLAGESCATLRARTTTLRAHLARNGFLDTHLAEAFAIVSLACKRELGLAPYDTQLLAARVMIANHLAEMATGEGKTLAAGMAAAAAALAGVPVHVITANDYLVERDAQTLRPLFQSLGLDVGAVTQTMDAAARRGAYASHITYCTAKELVFDYLRDRIRAPRRGSLEQRAAHVAAPDAPEKLLRGLCMGIVDEADNTLIDEARVPLILSRPLSDDDDGARHRHAWALSGALDASTHFTLDHETRSASLSTAGRAHLKALAAETAIAWPSTRHCEDAVRTALAARHLLHAGRDYLVRSGQVLIIDETTGRSAPGRTWSRGLHQVIEIKEGCAPSIQTVPLVQITFQRFFRRYLRLGGMSGTLMEARAELKKVYGLEVIAVPPHRPNRRRILPPRVFRTREAQWSTAVARVQTLHALGQPVLIGTDSVRDSEALAQRLAAANLPHTVLNANQDQHEAAIIAAAGQAGAITVATNMAGRGTDITLGPGVAVLGGLHVLCCQQNGSHRIDRQLIGRCARQGDPGSAETFITLDGPLLPVYGVGRLLRGYTVNTEIRRGWWVAKILRVIQFFEERRQRRERNQMLRKDDEMNRWFAFSGTEN